MGKLYKLVSAPPGCTGRDEKSEQLTYSAQTVESEKPVQSD